MTFWKSIGGLMELEIVSAEPEAALSAMNRQGIALYQVRHEKELVMRFSIQRSNYHYVEAICKKRGESLRVIRRYGLYFTAVQLWNRKLLLLGVCFLIWLAAYLPTRVLFVQVEGNTSVATNRILSAAQESGIQFGASRRKVRSERVKNALLDAVPQLQWAGVNTRGCTAVISVRERTPVKSTSSDNTVASIVADRDGYILSSVVTRGTGQVQPGQAVKEGQVLISGYTDCGICIQATHAEGEILAQTQRVLHAVTPADYVQKGCVTRIKRRYSLLLGKKRIFFWKDSGISDAGCDRIYKEYRLTLPGGFSLPAALCIDVYSFFDSESGEIPQKEAAASLKRFAGQYLTGQMVAGEICSDTQTVVRAGTVYRLNGSYVCKEMIGKVRLEQIGETNGETNGKNR